jgi:hypothetical protein
MAWIYWKCLEVHPRMAWICWKCLEVHPRMAWIYTGMDQPSVTGASARAAWTAALLDRTNKKGGPCGPPSSFCCHASMDQKRWVYFM